MSRVRSVFVGALLAGFGLSLLGGTAVAIPPFQKEFVKMYVKPGSPLEAQFKKVKCNVCHYGKSKKNRNAYGKALEPLLDRKKDKKNVEKIRQALRKVESLPSDPNDPNSPTFGELLRAGKLPASPK